MIATTILTPEGAPEWTRNSEMLWNTVEAGEKRVDAQLAREFILALPVELDAQAQFAVAKEWAQRELVASGMVVEISLHHDKANKNPHVHLLASMRRLEGEKFSTKKATDWNRVDLLVEQRHSWAEAVNAALEKAGSAERVDHRSLKDRGLDQLPQPKVGVAAVAMQRRGAVSDPKRFQDLRFVKLLNEVMPHRRAIEKSGEVKQMGAGSSWWEKSAHFLSRVKDTARETVVDAWNAMLEPWRRGKLGGDHAAHTHHEHDLSR